MANDYYKMITTLFGFKNNLDKIATEKSQKLIDYFKATELKVIEGEEEFPDASEIAIQTGLPPPKVRNLIRDLYINVLDFFVDNNLEMKESVQIIYIHFPYDEEHTIHKNYREEAKKMSLWIQVKLPVIPRLGEEIFFDFIDNDFKYNHGHVVEISHKITCQQQRTIIHVHPLKNYFHQWEKLRVSHELKVKNNEKIG
jgi:hypothetical protein